MRLTKTWVSLVCVLGFACTSPVVLAKGWVKLEQATAAVVSTMNVAVVLMPNATVWAAHLNEQGRIDEQAQFKPMTTHNGMVLSGVVEVVAGEGHVLARRANGEVWAAGDNTYGQLGHRTLQTQARFVPCLLEQGEPIRLAAAIVAGRDHSLILLETGVVMSAGRNQHGQLGQGHRQDRAYFSPCVYADGSVLSHIVGIESNDNYSLLLRQDETRWLAGRYPKLSIFPDGKIVTFNSFIEF